VGVRNLGHPARRQPVDQQRLHRNPIIPDAVALATSDPAQQNPKRSGQSSCSPTVLRSFPRRRFD
jgi:hypothetical protein